MKTRDEGCRFPGCTHKHYIDGHHIQHWSQGGETSLANLVQLCRHRHRLVHEGEFDCRKNGQGLIEFRNPEGKLIPRTGELPRISPSLDIGCPFGKLQLMRFNSDFSQRVVILPQDYRWVDSPIKTIFRYTVKRFMVSKKMDDADLEEIREFYDDVYYSGASTAGASPIPRHYFRLFRRLKINRGANVLDVACGTGEWLDSCTSEDCSVSGVDLSAKAIAVCKERLPQGKFYAQPAETLPFDDESFDVVTCLGSLEHFVDPVSSLKEMARVARADAKIVILVPNKDFLTRKLGLFGGTYQVDAKEVVRTLDEWDELFVAGGLSVAERWKDLHVLNIDWIKKGKIHTWPFRALQGLLLAIWPLRWQYQVYHRCIVRT